MFCGRIGVTFVYNNSVWISRILESGGLQPLEILQIRGGQRILKGGQP